LEQSASAAPNRVGYCYTFFAQSITANWLHIHMFVRNKGKNFQDIWYWGCILKVPVENFVTYQL
jgi:hypothetical protein